MELTPKILLFDIETFPTVIESWEVHEADYLRILRPTTIAAFAAKWLDSEVYIVKALCDYIGYRPIKLPRIGPVDDRKIVKDLWNLLDEADIVIAHNGDRFDVRKVNARFATHKLPPPRPYQTIDTLKESRKVFGFDSHRLNEKGRVLGVGIKKDSGGINTWIGCLEGDREAWKRMKTYVKGDVELLEKIYKADRPWMKKHPNLNLYKENTHLCPHCGSNRTQRRGYSFTRVSKFQRFQCKDCGAWSQGEKEFKAVIR